MDARMQTGRTSRWQSRGRWIGRAALVAIALVSVTATSPVSARKVSDTERAQMRRDFEAGMMDSRGGLVFQTIRRLFPADYEKLLKENMKSIERHGDDEAGLRRAIGATLAKFYERKMPDAINASAPLLVKLNLSQLDLVRSFRKDHVQACAEYVENGAVSETNLTPAVQDKVIAVSIATLEAAKSGSERPRDRNRGKMDDDIAVAWMEKVHEIETSEFIEKMFGEETTQEAATPAENCRMGIAIYGAVAAMPTEQAAKMAAILLKGEP